MKRILLAILALCQFTFCSDTPDQPKCRHTPREKISYEDHTREEWVPWTCYATDRHRSELAKQRNASKDFTYTFLLIPGEISEKLRVKEGLDNLQHNLGHFVEEDENLVKLRLSSAFVFREKCKEDPYSLYSNDSLKQLDKLCAPNDIEGWLRMKSKRLTTCADKWLINQQKGDFAQKRVQKTLNNEFDWYWGAGAISLYLRRQGKYQFPALLAVQTKFAGIKHPTGTVTFYKKEDGQTVTFQFKD